MPPGRKQARLKTAMSADKKMSHPNQPAKDAGCWWSRCNFSFNSKENCPNILILHASRLMTILRRTSLMHLHLDVKSIVAKTISESRKPQMYKFNVTKKDSGSKNAQWKNTECIIYRVKITYQHSYDAITLTPIRA